MDYILLVAIIVMLLHHKLTTKSKLHTLNRDINKLNARIEKLLRSGIAVQEKPKIAEAKDTVPAKPTLIRSEISKTAINETTKEESQSPISEPQKSKPLAEKPDILAPLAGTEKMTSKSLDAATSAKPRTTPQPKTRVSKPRKPSLWERFKEKNPDLEKFIGENLINKIGILILVLGISYFVRFAIDKNWINEPARVGIGILVGSLILGIAHKLRKKYAAFSSVLVAGAIAIFYYTIAIAFHDYQLFSQTVAFSIMVLITAFSCLISVSYNRMELAVLSLIGGFAVPFMISAGSGNYVVLFTYIVILDIGILALAYFKKWILVTTLAFAFTTLLFGGWVIQEINKTLPHYLGAFIFAFVFYSIFVITNIINNLRTRGTFSKSQLIILGLNTFVFYGLGMLILSNYHPEFSGLFTALLAVLNLVYAWFLYKKFGLDKTAVYILIGMTLTFITLAIPIQFKGNYITLFWAAEGALLLWLAQKSKIKSYRFASVIVHMLMLISLIIDWGDFYGDATKTLKFIINPIFITGMVAIGSLLVVWYLLKDETEILKKYAFSFNPKLYRKIAIIAAIVLGYLVGMIEVIYQTDLRIGAADHVLFSVPVLFHFIYTAILCFFLYRKKETLYDRIVVLMSLINIIIFSFVFLQLPFFEIREHLLERAEIKLAFYLHYISLLLTIFFFYFIYKTNKRREVFPAVNRRLVIWVAAFLIVFIASREVLLHGVQLMDLEVTPEELAIRSNAENYQDSENSYIKTIVALEHLDTAKEKIIKTSWPVTWGVLAFVFLIIGIRRQVKDLRIFALALLGITIAKLFLYDISNVSETGKIIAFILLGVLILVISFVYQKLKSLVIDEEKTPEKDA